MSINAQYLGDTDWAFRIGDIAIETPAILAPMSGVTDIGMRRVAQATGAGLVVSEMVAADEFINGRQEARLRAEGEGITVHAVQIAGCEPRWMGEAARLAEASGARIVDINMGCPSKRVNGKSSGSALMRNLDHATALIRATVAAAKCPVTLKMRLGWDDSSCNAPELARRAEAEGVKMVTVHGRTRQQFYKGQANWDAIAPVREAVTIPLVANGDCENLAGAKAMLEKSGADAVMIGRAAVGRPWLVGEIGAALAGRSYSPPGPAERLALALQHLETLVEALGERAGIRHARKHLAGYADHAPGAAQPIATTAMRQRLVTSETLAEVKACLAALMQEAPQGSQRTAQEAA